MARKELAAPASGRRKMDALTLALAALFFCQAAVIVYFNLTQMRNHIGYDSSWNILRAALMWDEKTLINPAWSETTNLHLDTPMSIASLLYGLTGNLLLSFGLADLAVVALLGVFVWKILARMKVGLTGRLIALNMVVCPYMTNEFFPYNDLGYFSCVLSGAAYYSLRTLFVLMLILELLQIAQEGRIGPLGLVLLPVCLLSGFSFGVFLIIILFIPFFAWQAELAALKNDWRQLVRKECLYALGCCALVAAGKVIALRAVHFEAMDSTRTWTTLEGVWTNFGAVVQGFLKLMQVLPGETDTYRAVLSTTGLLRLFILAMFALLAVAVCSVARRTLKTPAEAEKSPVLFLLNIAGLNFLVFGLFNVRYGGGIFEERYLIPTFFVLMLITALFFDRLEPRRVLTGMLTLGMTLSLALVDVHSDFNYLHTTNDAWQMDEIQALAEGQQAGVVYFWGQDLAVVGRALRPCDLGRVYKELPDEGGWFIHWGDYTTYDNPADYSGPTLLICPREGDLVPERVLGEYSLLAELDQVRVYASDHNPQQF